MNNIEAVQILNPLRNLTDDLAGPCLAEGSALLHYEVVQALPTHVLRHYDVVVFIFGEVDKPQGVSAFAFSDLLQQLDFLWSFVTLTVHLCEVLFINELGSNFETSCLMPCQDDIA